MTMQLQIGGPDILAAVKSDPHCLEVLEIFYIQFFSWVPMRVKSCLCPILHVLYLSETHENTDNSFAASMNTPPSTDEAVLNIMGLFLTLR